LDWNFFLQVFKTCHWISAILHLARLSFAINGRMASYIAKEGFDRVILSHPFSFA